MKFLVTKTFYMGDFYDRLFLLKDRLIAIAPLYEEHDIAYSSEPITIPDLPAEIKMKIIKQTICELLKDRNFEQTLRLIAINHYMIHHIYYAIYGCGSERTMEKYHRISRTLQILLSIFDNYLCAEQIDKGPVIVLESEQGWVLSNCFFPWQMAGNISVISVQYSPQGEIASMGPYYGDQALLIAPYEQDGIVNARGIGFPYFHFLVMDNFRCLSVFTSDKKTRYYFGRFAMFVRACFGLYSRVYFFTEAIPLTTLESDDDMEAIFDRGYCFQELPFCVRK